MAHKLKYRKHTAKGFTYFETDSEVMLFTGFYDKNGKEIYEDDQVSRISHDTANFPTKENKKVFVSYVEWKYGCWYVGFGNFKNTNPVGSLDTENSRTLEVVR